MISTDIIWLSPPPRIVPVPGHPKLIQTCEDLLFLERGAVRRIPSGFPSDGASFPHLARILFDRFDPRFLRSALRHDFGFSAHDFAPDLYPLGFSETNRCFEEGLRAEPFSRGWARVFWRCVESPLGWAVWKYLPNDPLAESYFRRILSEGYRWDPSRPISSPPPRS